MNFRTAWHKSQVKSEVTDSSAATLATPATATATAPTLSGRSIWRRAFLDSIPVMTGYLFLGFGFGVLLTKSGFSWWLALLLSVFVYAGAMQYLAVGLLSGGISLVTIALTTLMVNMRYMFFSVALLNKYRGAGWRKPYMIFGLTDETFSLIAQAPPDLTRNQDRFRYCFALTLLDQIYWVFGCVTGALAGSILPFSSEGIDFALTALFLCIVTDLWLQNKSWMKRFPGIIGALASIFFLVLLGPNRFLVPAMLLIVGVLLLARPALGVHEVPVSPQATSQKGADSE